MVDIQRTQPAQPAQRARERGGRGADASSSDEARGLFGRLADRLTRTTGQDEAEELREDAKRVGATPICDLPNRERARVCGSVRSVTLRPRADIPALVVEIYDGSKTLNLVWLGRREIAGIHAGVQLRATGRVSYYRGIPTIFNPFYEIVPTGG